MRVLITIEGTLQRFDQQIDLAQSGPSLIGALALARSRFEQRQPAVDRKRASP